MISKMIAQINVHYLFMLIHIIVLYKLIYSFILLISLFLGNVCFINTVHLITPKVSFKSLKIENYTIFLT